MKSYNRPLQRRVIINSDAKNEADDQFALVHALLSPTLDIRGIIAAHFGTHRTTDSMMESRQEVDLLLDLLGQSGKVPVANGAPDAIPDESTPIDSAGARLIIDEAMALPESERPLFIGFLGPLTDMASAILLEPSIVDKDIVVIWVGGPSHDPGIVSVGSWPEFNLKNDIAAANVVFESGVTLWQIPSSVYRMVNVGYAELEAKVEPHGALGSYLVKQTREFNAQHHKVPIESRSLGDSPVVGLMLEPWGGVFRRQPPVRFSPDGHYTPSASGSEVLVLEQADTRFLLEDMYAKIAQHAEKPR